MQSARLMQGMGDVYPSDAKIGLLERLARLHPDPTAQSILGQSGADAVTAAVKTAVLSTGRTGLVAFGGSYHGLSYGALGVSDLRSGYRAPFTEHLPRDVEFLPYPTDEALGQSSLVALKKHLQKATTAAVIIEPILGRGGVIEPPTGFLGALSRAAHETGTLVISDEIWTGLGRTGAWLAGATDPEFHPDLICIGKGLGGGLPISACMGPANIMAAWSQDEEVVHTSTFAGAPLACTAALATLDVLGRQKWIEHSAESGNHWITHLRALLHGTAIKEVRGRGYMIGLDASELPGGGVALQRALLERGFHTSTGGGKRDVLVLTPPLNITNDLLMAFEDSLRVCVMMLAGR
jgi:4-aminobutyrate aminotransferase/(S)-3-amino-2-methylpropionate transaminase